MRSRDLMLALGATAIVALFCSMQERISAQSPSGIVISELRFHGAGTNATTAPNDEFIELFNTSTTARDITGWTIRSSNNNTPPVFNSRVIIKNFVLNPGCYFLVTNSAGYTGGVIGDQTYAVGFADNGGVALQDLSSQIVDQVGLGTAAAAYGEGTRLPALTTDANRGYERNSSVTQGYVDSNNNFADFHQQAPSTPQNSTTACVPVGVTPPPVIRVPHEIQGDAATSPFAIGTTVNVRGVVTARKSDGFFIQTAPGTEDGDANTSEGLFVAATGAPLSMAQPGHLVTVAGAVAELVPAGDPGSASVTALNSVTNVTDGGAATLPAPYALTNADLADTGTLDQLERLEGMRVSAASLTAVSGTGSDGAFFAVLTGQARPFREPGVESGHTVLPCAIGPCNISVFDGNPERLRVDSDALDGVALVNVSTGAVMTSVVGPLDFGARAYTVLPEATLIPSGGTALFAAPPVSSDQFTVASFNMQRFAELPSAAYQIQLAKASLTVRDVMNTPDIVGLQGVESLTVLAALAARIDTDVGLPDNRSRNTHRSCLKARIRRI
ncbi:MAG: lamin tail domain-containing protein [Acidobacteriota bacterium]